MTTENARTREKVTVIINQKPYHFDQDEGTGLELKERAEIPLANLLFLEESGPGDDVPIGDDQVIVLKPGEHFYDMPPGNFGADS